MANLPPNPTGGGLRDNPGGAGVDGVPVVELCGEQLYTLCLAVAFSLEDDHPTAELAELRSVLESVEIRLLLAWADLHLAGWGQVTPAAGAAGTGVG